MTLEELCVLHYDTGVTARCVIVLRWAKRHYLDTSEVLIGLIIQIQNTIMI